MAAVIESASMKLIVSAIVDYQPDIGTAKQVINHTKRSAFSTGTGLNQINRIWQDSRNILASGTDDLDLAGGLTDVFGNSLTFTKIKGLFISAAAANTNDVVVGGDASAAFFAFLGADTDKIVLKPGAWFALANPSAAGYAVTATTADILQIANSSSGTAVDYDIILLGTV